MRRQQMQKQHLLGAGLIATLVAIYPFAANLGVVPQDATQLLKIPPGMSHISLPNGTNISLTDLQQQLQRNPNLTGLVNGVLQQYNGNSGYGNTGYANTGFNQGYPSSYGPTNYGNPAPYNQGWNMHQGNGGVPYQSNPTNYNQTAAQPYPTTYGQNPYSNPGYGNSGYNNSGSPYGATTQLTSYGGGYRPDEAGVHSFTNGNCTQFIVEEIQRAQRKIFIQTSSFTSQTIAEALIKAHQRQIEVFVILDRGARQEAYSQATFMTQYGVTILFNDQSAPNPTKFMLIDGAVTISAGFNFTNQVETGNADHVMVFRNRPDVYSTMEATFKQAYLRSVGAANTNPGVANTQYNANATTYGGNYGNGYNNSVTQSPSGFVPASQYGNASNAGMGYTGQGGNYAPAANSGNLGAPRTNLAAPFPSTSPSASTRNGLMR